MSGPYSLHAECGDGDPGPVLLTVPEPIAAMAAAILADATGRVMLTFGPGRYYRRTVPHAARVHELARERAEWARAEDYRERFTDADTAEPFDPYRGPSEYKYGAPA